VTGAVTRTFEASVVIGGIFTGSALWWFMLSGGVGFLRKHFTEHRLIAVNRVTAIGLIAIAAWAFVSGVQGYMS